MSLDINSRQKLACIDHDSLSLRRRCELLSVSRSTLYYEPMGESELNLRLMRLMDEHYLEHSYKGARRMHVWLTKDLGYNVSRNRIDRLYYKVMGLQSLLPGPHTSKRNRDHQVYPYLLRDLEIVHPNQVWATDITYVPMKRGFLYLTAVIDLYSRYVVHWKLANSMEAIWCRDLVAEALEIHQVAPKIFNTDQGVQYTSKVFTNFILDNKIRLSMDGKGRATDNAFIERLWRSVKYEQLYLNEYQTGKELYDMLEAYFAYYNTARRHSSIQDEYPEQWYQSKVVNKAAA
jgi:putative transposase